jgi:hypothetical protein
MVYLKRESFLLCLLLVVLFFSCTTRISGSLAPGGTGEFAISTSLEPRMAALIRTLVAMGGGGEFALNGEAIAQSMTTAPGVDSVSFRNTGPVAIEGLIKISKIGDFLAPAGGAKGFITFEEAKSGGGRLTINLNREVGPEILSLISPEVADYLSALMAPLATGEGMTKAEYLVLVSSVYGKVVADEISRSSIRAAIDFSSPVNAVRGGTYSGKQATFTIPLLDLLVLESPLAYEVTWK